MGILDTRLSRFTVISGIGWLIDLSLMLGLVALGLGAFEANLVGAFCGVSFVFVAAQRRVFVAAGGVRLGMLAAYLAWHAIAITAASALIGLIAGALAGPAAALRDALAALLPGPLVPGAPLIAAGAAKALVTPLTLYANFLVMGRLLEGRVSWR
ncbi:MAG: hypothetical protein AAF074_15540 [Pseudomonadota bacterium]